MTTLEKRYDERFILKNRPKGKIFLCINKTKFFIDEIFDFSNSGIRFELNQPISVSSSVSIEYNDESVKLEVYGRVAWCKEVNKISSNDDLYKYNIGIQLLSPATLFAMLQ
jgi:hypothetical protein